MDELLRHCLQELAFDGDLGCDVYRLQDFVRDFYVSRNSMQQNLDDSYHAFVWSLLAQQPSVRIGVLPEGQTTQVYVPPQPRVSRKGKNVQDDVQEKAAAPVVSATLELIPDAKYRAMNELVQHYGHRLRIAVDPETCFIAITGSHAKPAKLTPMVYASLQLISRSRESGISVLELGKATGYDQKTCFYVVKQLVDMDLIVKLRQGGNSQNFCVHKYFFERNPIWKNIREEELRAAEETFETQANADGSAGDAALPFQLPQFDPIDTRHLTGLNILRQRIIKFLKHSPNQIQPYTNISVKLGFRPSSRTDRRFFLGRLKELINEGTIEKVVSSTTSPDSVQGRQIYLRLGSSGGVGSSTPSVESVKVTDDDEDMINDLVAEAGTEDVNVKSTLPLHRQVIDVLQESSTRGATLNELSDRLGMFDKRTLELLISRMERQSPPAHLADLSIIQVLETHGRERRYRFFTLGGYLELISREGLAHPSSRFSAEDVADAGGFMENRESDFYETNDELQGYLRKWTEARIQKSKPATEGKGKSSRGPKRAGTNDNDRLAKVTPEKKWTNPILPDGTRKRGRPLKSHGVTDERGSKRSKKKKGEDDQQTSVQEQTTPVEANMTILSIRSARKRKRGEAESKDPEEEAADVQDDASRTNLPNLSPSDPPPKRKRGRPPKKKNMSVADPAPLFDRDTSTGVTGTDAPAPAIDTPPTQSRTFSPGDEKESSEPSHLPTLHYSPSSPTLPLSAQSSDSVQNTSPEILAEGVSSTPLHQSVHVARSSFASPDVAGNSADRQPGSSVYQFGSPVSSPMFPQEHSATLAPVNDHSHTHLEPLPEIVAAFGKESLASAGHLEADNEVTRVIVALAAQVNASLSSSSSVDNGNRSAAMPLPSTPQGRELSEAGFVEEDESLKESVPLTEGIPVKLPTDNILASEPSPEAKRITSVLHGRKTNISVIRRENEIVQVIEKAGGIMNTSTSEFHGAYMEFIDTAIKAGEVTSTPSGSRLDRRTLTYTLDKLEENGRIKTITTIMPLVTGAYRNARLAYLPTVSEERLRDYIAAQRKSDIPIQRGGEQEQDYAQHGSEHGPDSPLNLARRWLYSDDSQDVYHEKWHKNVTRSEQLFSYSDDIIREALLMERQTLSQLYGYLNGKIARAAELHLGIVKSLERSDQSPFVLSRDPRIVNWSFFTNDISLATLCGCITAPVFRNDIQNALATSEGRNQLLKDIPNDWKKALQIGKARFRERIFDLLEHLQSLRLVIPMRRSDATFPDAESHPTAFEAMPLNWANEIPLMRPEYWQIYTSAPVYLFALQKDAAPCWKMLPVASEVDAAAYWSELKASSLDRGHAENTRQEATASTALFGPYVGEQRVANILRRSAAWSRDYMLSWYQTQYLKTFVNTNDGTTPLQDQDHEMSRLQRISQVLSAPLDVVRNYFESSRKQVLYELQKKRRREDRRNAEKKEEEKKLFTTRKKLDAVRNSQSAWDAMVAKVHPGLVKGVAAGRLRKLRQSYIRGDNAEGNYDWEYQISEAIKAAEKVRSSRKLFHEFAQVTRRTSAPKQSETDSTRLPRVPQDKTVDSLIDMQKSALSENGGAEAMNIDQGRRSSRKKDKAVSVGRIRRQRFQWNADYDELVRDSYVILRARCRTHHRLEWSPISQVFPSVLKNSVRLRMSILKEHPGAEAYLQRLESCWHDLWIQNRGTLELPDPKPHSPIEFDLKAHLEYLRKHVDKNAIRVGISNPKGAEYVALPADIDTFLSSWNLEERKSTHVSGEFPMNSSMGEDVREKRLLEAAFVMGNGSKPNEDSLPDLQYFVEASLKMVIGTPNEIYNAGRAAALLHGIGETDVGIAMENLIARNVISKVVRDPKKLAPGRTVKISEINQSALGGQIVKDLFSDASQLEESYEIARDEWREWPLTSTDGDTAALLQLFSDHKVDFDADTSRARAARPVIEGNSRKVDDDDIELDLRVKLGSITIPESQAMLVDDDPSSDEPDEASDHGTTILEEQACCRLRSDGVIDCLRCVEDGRAQMKDWPDRDRTIANSLVELVEDHGKHGIKVEDLQASVGADDQATGLIHRLHSLRVPLIYLTGYSSTIVVSAKYAGAWTVTLPVDNIPVLKIFPRRWLDIGGGRITMVWEAGLRAVIGMVHLRPGISQAELSWRLRAVYDRREIIDLLSHLMSSGLMRCFYKGAWRPEDAICLDGMSKEEDKMIFWTIREERHWYRLPQHQL